MIYWFTYSKNIVLSFIKYHYFFFTENASRRCQSNGVWENFSDYMSCRPLDTSSPFYPDPSIVYTSYFYYGGYTISLVALVAAVSIFVYFK